AEQRLWRNGIYEIIRSWKPEQGSLGVERMCQLAGVSRASYYRYLEIEAPAEAEMEVRVGIQEVVLAHHRRYGYRRVTVELHRRGMRINHKRRSAHHARGQSAGDPTSQVHSDHRLQA